VERALDPLAAIAAIEEAFRASVSGALTRGALFGVPAPGGSFHVKAALQRRDGEALFVAKMNANVPANPASRGLPTIQGVLVLFDADSGTPLAIMESSALTALRTAAATAVAARHLAREDATTVTLVGCGAQAMPHLAALAWVRPLTRAWVLDRDAEKARDFARRAAAALSLDVRAAADLGSAARASDIVVTCTTSTEPFVARGHLSSGTFVAAVGADNAHKQELETGVLTSAAVVVDDLEQCAMMGELHHAIAAGVLTRDRVRADLASVVVDPTAGRRSDDEIVVFDSTGVALEDMAVAAVVHRRTLERGDGLALTLLE
jgi:ornithine cyclodeaminase/alanine dehydrogenase-like protein (mu-crystallin family)